MKGRYIYIKIDRYIDQIYTDRKYRYETDRWTDRLDGYE